jgi:predicted helicase
MNPTTTYFKALHQHLATGQATEHTYRPALAALIEALGNDVTAINEPARIACGAPDLAVLKDSLMVGYVEAKDIGANLDAVARTEQLTRYRRSLENLILTDYLDFHWYVDGEVRRTARLGRLDMDGSIKVSRTGAQNVADLLGDFLAHEPQPIATPRELAERMARLTHLIRDIIVAAFEQGQASDLLTGWRQAFAEVLIPGLDEPEQLEQFADMFAQTLAYGLFSARVMHPHGDFTRHRAQELIPRTNPFLRDFFSYITGPQLSDEPYVGFVNDLIQILAQSDMEAILADFGRRTRREDPMVHFYETFLAAYDPHLRDRRGVFYTPNPIVLFIVRSVDALLKSHFGLPDGLADTTRLPDGRHKVLALDPATGTATFLYAIIDLIRETFMLQGNAGMWSGYVQEHLLERIFGFELLMAPYAVAHFKLALQLAGYDLPEAQQADWAYDFSSDERLQIYLTNALEKAVEEPPRLIGPTKIVAEEAQAANEVKQETPIMVIVGNPPYAVSSANKGEHIEALMDRYKAAVRDERNIQPLSDDYIKFIRFAHDRVERTGYGIIGFITNHSYLFGLIHRGVREELLKTFDEIYVLNLHGSALMGETPPDGGKDENVFDIRQGVAIVLLVKTGKSDRPATVRYADLWGERENKYRVLNENDVRTVDWEALVPTAPHFFFVPKDFNLLNEYEQGWKIDGAFPLNSTGIKTHRDHFAIEFDEGAFADKIRLLKNERVTDETIRRRFGLNDTRDWKLREARESLQEDLDWDYGPRTLLYRPFDFRAVYYSNAILELPKYKVMYHMLEENLALVTSRVYRRDVFSSVLVSNVMTEMKTAESTRGTYCFPLYLYPDENAATLFDDTATSPWDPDPDHGNRVPNLSQAFVDDIKEQLGLPFDAHKVAAGQGAAFGPRDVLAYAYAIFHSPTYRERYAEFLKIDFPRVPLTSDADLFWRLVNLGDELIRLHLMEHPKLHDTFTSFPVTGSNRVKPRGGFPKFVGKGESRTKTSDVAERNRVYINLEQYFAGVPDAVWDFEVGGYQVLHKWLKDRKGRVLSFDELRHYQQMVVALQETMRVMDEVDDAIPGWPVE